MKVVFFVHCFFPDHFYGTETYTLDLAKNYQAAGHHVTVVTALFQGELSKGEIITHYEYQGIPVVCIDKNLLPHTRVKETYYQPEMRGILKRILQKLAPDVVHVTHLINHTAALLEVTQFLGIAVYGSFTDFFGICLNNKLQAANGSLCLGPSVSRTNCLACHLNASAQSPSSKKWVRYAISAGLAQPIASVMNVVRHLPGLKHGPMDGLVEDIVQRPDTLLAIYNAGYRAGVTATKFLGGAYKANGLLIPLHNIPFGVDIDRSPKLTIEKYLSLYRQLHGIRPVILRVANPYGERQRIETAQGAVGVFVHRALRGQPIEIWGDGSVTRDYVHVQDVADAFAQALVYEGDRTCFNISAGVGASLNELVFMLGEVLGQSLVVRYLPGRPFDVKVNVLSNALARQELGWVPRIGMREGLERTVEGMRQRLATGQG